MQPQYTLATSLSGLSAATGHDLQGVNSLAARNTLSRAYGSAIYQTTLVDRSIRTALGGTVPAAKRDLLAALKADVCGFAIGEMLSACGSAEMADLAIIARELAARSTLASAEEEDGVATSTVLQNTLHAAVLGEVPTVPAAPVAPAAVAELSLDELIARRAAASAAQSNQEAELRTHRRIDAVSTDVAIISAGLSDLRRDVLEALAKPAAPTVDAAAVERILTDALARLAPATVSAAATVAADLPKVPIADSLLYESETYHEIVDALRSGDFLIVFGPAGTGKSYPVEQACAREGRRFVSLSCNRSMSASVLLSNCRLKDGTTIDRDGVLVHCMRHGVTLLLDEFDNVETQDAEVINRVSEYWSITVPETGEVVDAHPDFRLVLTANAVGDTTGTYDKAGVPPTLLRRARLLRACNMTFDKEVDVVTRTGLPKREAEELVQWFAALRPHHYGTNGVQATLKVAPSLAIAVKAARYMVGASRRAGIPAATKLPKAKAIWQAYAAQEGEYGFQALKATKQWFSEWDAFIA